MKCYNNNNIDIMLPSIEPLNSLSHYSKYSYFKLYPQVNITTLLPNLKTWHMHPIIHFNMVSAEFSFYM